MKNRKFIGKDGLQAICWDIETYTSKLFDAGKACFFAEFSYSTGYHTMNLDLDTAIEVNKELTKFIIEAVKKQEEFKSKQKKAKK
jgi:stalled ribosome rescue protein Dom34